ncbi:hypothetical protein GQ457_06G009030 [Hibiscus cannabinus]
MAYWDDEVERKCRGIFMRLREDKVGEDIFSTKPAGLARRTCTQPPGPLMLCTCHARETCTQPPDHWACVPAPYACVPAPVPSRQDHWACAPAPPRGTCGQPP